MYYPDFTYYNEVEVEIPNPYGLPPDPVSEDNNEDENGNSYFNKVIKQMYKTHKNEFLFPVPMINTSKSMEISNLHPIVPPHKSHSKKNSRHKSDPVNPNEKKKNHLGKNSRKAKTSTSSSNGNKTGSEPN